MLKFQFLNKLEYIIRRHKASVQNI